MRFRKEDDDDDGFFFIFRIFTKKKTDGKENKMKEVRKGKGGKKVGNIRKLSKNTPQPSLVGHVMSVIT